MSDNKAGMHVQNAAELGALMMEQHRARLTAGQYPDGNPNSAMASQSKQTNMSAEVETPMQMRAEIFRHEYDHPIIRRVMTVADVNGHSSEDRYTMLAFWLLKDNITMRDRLMEMATNASTPKPIVTVLAEDLERTEKQRDLLGRELKKTRNGLDALGVAISNAGYEWTPEMRKAYEDGTK